MLATKICDKASRQSEEIVFPFTARQWHKLPNAGGRVVIVLDFVQTLFFAND